MMRKTAQTDFLEGVIPADLPTLRAERRSDRRLVTDWIQRGRAEGAFRDGPTPTAASVDEYRRGLIRRGWSYESRVIVSAAGRDIGYVDWRSRGKASELLGLYLLPAERRGGIGRWAIRRACVELAYRGARRVTALVYAQNEPSLKACRAAGLGGERLLGRQESGRSVLKLTRSLAMPERLGPRFALYSSLRGRNRFLEHATAAEAISERFGALQGVQAVLGLGSLGRGFADEHSDLDLAVLGNARAFDSLWRGERWISGLDVDLFGVDLDASPPGSWDVGRRQAFREGVVLFRRDRSLVPLLRQAVSLARKERDLRVQETLLKLGWLGYGPSGCQGARKYGYLWSLPPDLWDQRGSTLCAHATIDQALDGALQLLFLLNGELPPDPKWRRFLAEGVAWRPVRLSKLLTTVESSPRTTAGLPARKRAVIELVDLLTDRAERLGSVRGDIYGRYLRSSADYDPGA